MRRPSSSKRNSAIIGKKDLAIVEVPILMNPDSDSECSIGNLWIQNLDSESESGFDPMEQGLYNNALKYENDFCCAKNRPC